MSENKPNYIGYGVLVVILLLLVLSVKIVGAGERGVLLTVGKVDGQVFEPGVHFVVPYFQTMHVTQVRIQLVEHDASAASKDLQIVTTKVALNFHPRESGVASLYDRVGWDYENIIINPAIQEAVKASTARFTAEELITKRDLVKEELRNELALRLDQQNITVDQVSITNFDFSPQFNAQIEAKVTALQKALTEENNLKSVKFQAEQKVAEAKGHAEATLVNAQAEAQAIQLTAEALKQNPQLIQLEWVKRWDGVLPSTALSDNVMPIFKIN